MTLGEKVLLLRRRRGLTQEGLAKAVGVAKNTISRLEQGSIEDVRGATVGQLARVLQTSADYLLGLKDDEEDTQPAPADPVAA